MSDQRQRNTKPQKTNQPVPYSQEAEAATIGAILINPAAYFSIASFLQEEDFFLLRHRYIWQAIRRLAEAEKPIEYLTLIEELRDIGKLDDIGGPAYITQLINSTPTSVHAEVYARLVETKNTRRQLIAASDEIRAIALNDDITTEQVVNDAHARLVRATGRTYSQMTVGMNDAVGAYYETIRHRVQSYQAGNPEPLGVPTGLSDLDRLIDGLSRKTVTLVGGVTGAGKTAFCLQVALNAARLGARVAFFPLERSQGVERMMNRLLGMEAHIPRKRLEKGELSKDEWLRFSAASKTVAKLPLVMFDFPKHDAHWKMTPKQLLATCNTISYQHGLDLVVVDWFGVMSADSDKPLKEYDEKVYIAEVLPHVADRLNVPLLVAAQVNEHKVNERSIKRRRPEVGDIMYVGEKYADVVIYLYRESMYNPKAEDKGVTELIVAKNRDAGEPGTVYAEFDGQSFRDLPDERNPLYKKALDNALKPAAKRFTNPFSQKPNRDEIQQ